MIFYLTGPDTFRAREKLHEIKEKFRREVDPTGESIEVIDGMTLAPQDLAAVFGRDALFTRRRCVIIENVTKSKNKEIDKAIVTELEKRAKAGDTANLIIFFENDEPAAKNVLHIWLQKHAYAQSFAPLVGRAVETWVTNECKKRGHLIERDALRWLIENTNGDLWHLNREIEKLHGYLETNEPISLRVVKEMVSANDEEEIFPLIDAMVSGNISTAGPMLTNYLNNGESPQALIALLESQLRVLVSLTSSAKQAPPGVHPFVVRKLTPLSKTIDGSVARRLYDELARIDVDLKTSNTDPKTALLNFALTFKHESRLK